MKKIFIGAILLFLIIISILIQINLIPFWGVKASLGTILIVSLGVISGEKFAFRLWFMLWIIRRHYSSENLSDFIQ